jgi:hypothetical protein
MTLPSPVGRPPLRELPGAWAAAATADDTINAAVRSKCILSVFTFMNKLLSFLSTIREWCDFENP